MTFTPGMPTELSSFVGRADELAALGDLMGEHRLVTLAGAGGCGKTRLASQLARSWQSGEVRWVLLEEADPDGVERAVARSAGALVPPGGDALDAVVRHLGDREGLVVLDNCEHVLDEAGRVVARLVAACPKVTVLATSRVPLGATGEHVWRVPPLTRADAVELLLDRASAGGGGHRPVMSAETAHSICDRLDRLPLALEFAAGWLGTLTATQVADALHEPFALLGDAAGRGTFRQQSLESSIRWSHDLLGPDEQRLFRRLAVCEPGFTADLVIGLDEALGAPGPGRAAATLGRLRRLVEASLVVADTSEDVARYRMLGVVRSYARARLVEAGESAAVSDALVTACLGHLASVASLLDTDKDAWRTAVGHGYLSARAAIEWGLTRPDPGPARELASGLAWLWHLEARGPEGLSLLRRALEVRAERTPVQVRLLVAVALVADTAEGGGGGYVFAQQAIDLVDDLLAVGDEADVEALRGSRRLARSLVAVQTLGADLDAAFELSREVRDEARAAGDGFVADACEVLLGFVSMQRDDGPATMDHLSGPVETLVARGDRGVASLALGWLALAHARQLELDDAVRFAERAVAVAEPLRDFHRIGTATCILAETYVLQGRLDEALAALAAIDHAIEGLEHPPFIPRYELTHALLAHEQGAPAESLEWARREARWLGDPGDSDSTGDRDAHLSPGAQLAVLTALVGLGARDEAGPLTERLLALFRDPPTPIPLAAALDTAGCLLHDTDVERALDLHHEALRVCRDGEYAQGAIQLLEAIAACQVARGDLDRAAVLLGAADAAREESGLRSHGAVRDPRPTLVSLMSAEDLVTAQGRGREMGLWQALTWAERSRGPRRRPDSGWGSLTPTENEVVELAAHGLTNPQIADRLFISRATVKTHLAHVYAKLGVQGRTELARASAERTEERTTTIRR